MPASPARISANQRNAQRSTGPRTVAGKQTSARNATRHGLLARHTLLPGEDPAELGRLERAIVERLEPEGLVEEILVSSVTGLLWRLRRVNAIETGLFAIGLAGSLGQAIGAATSPEAQLGYAFSASAEAFGSLGRYEAMLTRALERALADLERMRLAGAYPSRPGVIIPPRPTAMTVVS